MQQTFLQTVRTTDMLYKLTLFILGLVSVVRKKQIEHESVQALETD